MRARVVSLFVMLAAAALLASACSPSAPQDSPGRIAAERERKDLMFRDDPRNSPVRKEEVEKWLRESSFEPDRRAETFALEEFIRLAPSWAVFRRRSSIDSL